MNEEKKYYAIVTDIGAAAISNAALVGEKVNITELAVGDGGGAYYRPTADMTALRGERWRGNITSYEVDEFSPNVIVVKTVVPHNVGGFTMREMGLFDDTGRLLTIENLPDVEKVKAESGAAFDFEITTRVVVSNNSALNYVYDPTTVIATKKDIEEHNASAKAHENRFAKMADDVRMGFAPLNLHMENETIHVTPEQTEAYGVMAADLERHVNDSGIHVEAGEKLTWTNGVKIAEAAKELAQLTMDKALKNERRIDELEKSIYTNITANPFSVSFDAITGIKIVKGIWNQSKQRVEC